MVDAEKAKQPKVKKNKNSNLPDINLKSLIFGAYLKAVILGIVGATPLLYMAFAGFLGAYTPTEMGDLITSVAILGLGALMAFFGAYLYQGRAKAKEEYDIAKGTKGTKNVPVKPKEKKFEDTGNVKKNIANLFLPKGRRKK